ncbi:alpha/beta hydrolase [Pigmentiphaga aceris]|nr:alpha/beta hydrolase-fold protein [Pigmentiphaga aceris]
MNNRTAELARMLTHTGRWLPLFAGAALLTACGHGANVASTGAPNPVSTPDKTTAAHTDALGTATPMSLPGAYEFSMQSSQGKDYKIFVAVPEGKPPAEGFPVLYLLDGNAYFVSAASTMRGQSSFASMSRVQPVMVVGVGYPGEYLLNGERRSFDFLPVANGSDSAQFAALRAKPGGADAFLSFLVDELRPALARRYAIDPARQSLSGHSLGGYFTLHALLSRPDAFRSYAAISPSIWWDDARLLKEAEARLPSLVKPAGGPGIDVYLAVSPQELPSHPDRSAVMLSNAQTMNVMLSRAAKQGIHTRYQELPGENHISTNMAAMSAILRQASGNP